MTVEPIDVMDELRTAAQELDSGSTELAQLTSTFEGYVDKETGDYFPGPGMRFEVAVQTEVIRLYDESIVAEKRPPAEDVRRAKAEMKVREEQPDLWGEYHALKTRISALKIWNSARKASISARQSVLRGERG